MTDRLTPPEEEFLALLRQHASLGNGKACERTSNRLEANPMWNKDWFTEADYANDELDRFPTGADFPGKAQSGSCWGVPRLKCSRVGLSPRSPRRITGLRAFRYNPSREMRDPRSTFDHPPTTLIA